MRIATWNVNSIRIRLTHLTEWLAAAQPDVVLLQETKVENSLFPAATFTDLGYYVAAHGQKSYNGVAILSRTPLSEVMPGFAGIDHAGQARVLSATVASPAGPLRLVNAYVVNGETTDSPKFEQKREFYAALAANLAVQAGTYANLVLAGDFNVAADERDVDDVKRRTGKVLFTEAERGWFEGVKQAAGLHDALRLKTDAAGMFSWWDYREAATEHNRGLRIDYVLVSEPLKSRLKAVRHDTAERWKAQPSDHIPVVAELE